MIYIIPVDISSYDDSILGDTRRDKTPNVISHAVLETWDEKKGYGNGHGLW